MFHTHITANAQQRWKTLPVSSNAAILLALYDSAWSKYFMGTLRETITIIDLRGAL